MNNRDNHCAVTEIVSLDKTNKTGAALAIQKNIDKAVQKGHYEWVTQRVEETGQIKAE